MKPKFFKMMSIVLSTILLMGTFSAVPMTAAASDVAIVNLRTDYLHDPIGIDSAAPIFSWEMRSDKRAILQTAYQITVTKGEDVVWDSGKVESGDSINIEYAGDALQSQTAYDWNVRVWDNKGGETRSATASFETGLMNTDDWSDAKWIKYSLEQEADGVTSDDLHYAYEVDFQIVHDNSGFIFSAANTNNFFMWAVNTNTGTQPCLRRHININGSWAYVQDVPLPAQFTRDALMNREHRLKIEVKGGTVTTYIDDVLVDTYTDTFGALCLGLFGFRFHNEGGRFDNVKVTNYAGNYDRVLLSADFEDGINPFNNGQIVDFGGSKKLLIDTNQEIKVFETRGLDNSDLHYTFETDFQIVRDNVGIIFSAKNSGDLFMWAINTLNASHPYLRRHIFTGGSVSYTEDITLPAQFTKNTLMNAEHHLKIEVKGSTVRTYIDEVLVDTYADTSGELVEGYFGFRFHNEAARLDNVKAVSYTGASENILIDTDFEDGTNLFSAGNIVDHGASKKLFIDSGNEIRVLENRLSAAAMFRKDFTAENKEITSARLYFSSLGVSDVYINGVRVGRKTGDNKVYDELKPGWTDYDKTVFYLTYDVTDMIESGGNAIGAEVASGWYNGVIAVRGGAAYSGMENGLMVKLNITYADGSHQSVVTDNTWQANKNGNVLYADIYNGEIYDANRDAIDVWSRNGYSANGWIPAATKRDFGGKVMAAIGTTVQSREELTRTPESITKYSGIKQNGSTYGEIANVQNPTFPFTLKAGETAIFDMGQNMVGWERFTAKGAKNTVISIEFGEMLNDTGEADRKNDGPKGSIYNANYLEAKACGQYTMKGDAQGETYNPRFTFYGFRYVQLTATADIEILNLEGVVVGNANTENATFESSDASVNQLYSNIIWGQRCNFLSTATDCPQRNERLGWTADTHIFSRTAMYNSDAAGFYRKWLQDMRDSQFVGGSHDGAYPDIAPNTHIVGGGNGAWAEAGIIVPYYLYLMYGDVQLVEDHFASMEWFMDYLARQGDGQWKYNGGGAASGDWVSPELNDDSVKRYISVTYYAYAAQLMREMSAAIGNAEAEAKYKKLAEDIKAEFNTRYVNADGSLKVATQTTYLLALKLDLYATAEQRENGLAILLRKIKDNGNRLSTGFIGTSILNQTLSDVGATDMAYTLLLQHDHPSWLYSVDQGATTIWENWDSYTIEKGFKDPSMNSFNHYAYGAVGEFMYRYMAGIETDDRIPGFKHFILQPTPDTRTGENLPKDQQNLTFVNCTYGSIYGMIESSWKMGDDQRITYTATVPANTTATLYLPLVAQNDVVILDDTKLSDRTGVTVKGVKDGKMVIELGSGTYNFQVAVAGTDAPEYTEQPDYTLGDVDLSGTVDVADIMKLKALIMADKWSDTELVIGDMDESKKLDVGDIMAIKNIIMSK